MAICTFCDREMKTADGCAVTALTWHGESFPTFPYGRDPGWPATLALDEDGWPHFPKPDRRFRQGFRWVPAASVTVALSVAGFLRP